MKTEKKSKKPNYSEEQIAALLSAVNIASLSYQSQVQIVEELADENDLFRDKTKNQLMSKLAFLSNSGVKKQVDGSPAYIHKVYTTKTGQQGAVKKAEIVVAISELIKAPDGKPIDSDILGSLENATKPALLIVLSALTPELVD